MAVSYALKQALKNRKRASRRMDVVMLLVCVAIGLWEGGVPLTWHNLGFRIILWMAAINPILRDWQWRRVLPVSSLDDRAMLEYGVEFEQLGEAQQKQILSRYRVGTYLMNYFRDERDEAQDRESQIQAYAMMRWLLPVMAVIYALGWWLLPDGAWRASWTNAPVVMTWLFLVLLALPQLIWMWSEPDEIADPKLIRDEATGGLR
jgi:hypothetical protein